MSSRRPPACVLAVLTLALAAPAGADASPASRAPALQRSAEASFGRFAAAWMAEQRRRAAQAAPTLQPGAREPLTTYRGVGDAYRTELRATGRPVAPYVGVVHYTELVYACSGLDAVDCSVASETPQTAIFRYRDGRWTY